ncbi:hypothetical protein [Motiliproteus sp. SC1-56]|uniref:hypothetical protein n=1 Tax=Motiliproteus sp. SC1-56 TaxID=2799565 RepID=UPI001A8F9E49|nr:hypothetical protein [Motiliproteus sp. SC1-56]
MPAPSQYIGHVLFELDQLHLQAMRSGFDAIHVIKACQRIEQEINARCNEEQRAQMERMSRAYRQLKNHVPRWPSPLQDRLP